MLAELASLGDTLVATASSNPVPSGPRSSPHAAPHFGRVEA